MRSMLIVNPTSGPWDLRRELPAVLRYMDEHGWPATLHETTARGEATQLALEARDRGLGAVFVVGGDGTINEVANGLAESPVAMGVLPGGTGNYWAKEMGLPTRSPLHWLPLKDSIKALLAGRSRAVDLGKVNGRYFLQWAGLGLDAEVTYAMEPRSRAQRRLGPVAYIASGLAIAATMAGKRTRIYIDDELVYRRCILIVISNSQLYGGRVRLASDARLDDGLLDINVFAGTGFASALRTFFGVITGLHVRDPRYSVYQGRAIRVETDKPMPCHVDGEPFCQTPVVCDVIPRSLQVLIPSKVSHDLFSEGR